jgi:hypothetical protein
LSLPNKTVSKRKSRVCRVCVTAAFYTFYAFSAIVGSVSYGTKEGLKVQVPSPASSFVFQQTAMRRSHSSGVATLRAAPRKRAGGTLNWRLNARLKAASDS